MNKRSEAARRGLRIAARVAAVGALAIATTSMAQGSEPTPAATASTDSAVDRAAAILRVDGRAGGCFQPVTWGPPAPPACSREDLAGVMDEMGEMIEVSA